MKLFVHASGYKLTPWKTDQQEILATLDPKCGGNPNVAWVPSNKDFEVAGRNAGGSSPAASIDELLNVISRQSVESIEEPRILGHASKKWGLYLAGDIKNHEVSFDNHDDASIGDMDSSDPFRKAMPRFRELQDRFKADAKVVLMGCHSGGAASGLESVLSLVSHAFLRSTAGYKDEISLDFTWGPTGPGVFQGTNGSRQLVCNRVAPRSTITVRGKLKYGDDASPFKMDPWQLNPDVFSNEGDIFIAVRRKDPGLASTELAWRIMSEFYENHPYVSGASVATVGNHIGLLEIIRQEMLLSTISLKVRKQGTGMFIEVSPEYAKRTSPATLKNRVAEMGAALDLVGRKQEGAVNFK